MRFTLRYWTRRSALTVAVQCHGDVASMYRAAVRLRGEAAQNDLMPIGEAFLRVHSPQLTVMHLPIQGLDGGPLPLELRVGRIDHGPVVAAYDVPAGCVWDIAESLIEMVQEHTVVAGPFEFHFDPSVGRREGIVVLPVLEHPMDKAAFVAMRDARAS